MKEELKYNYIKRSQKDYSIPFKLSVVDEFEEVRLSYADLARKYGIQAHSTVRMWIEKYGAFDNEYQISSPMPKSKE